ncbi:2-hydroxyacid dehydrogenase [Thermanaeromonas sp. C210]|uniref:2-hydroxyacid dehydrogenase n=1 Tax=Thermanaeromonas sp. C210 TaxID=2731925 RepID=UPI00155C90A0|nr:D-glycerate dehydrogenase [Thermanaeromonas sp. C210]GFN22317.1 D-glycerate dehydrogenase [Thermanaeromonas sp. C210]
MSQWKVYVTRPVPQPAIDLLAERCEVEVNPEDRVLSKGELIEKIKGRDGVFCLLTDKIDAEVMDAAPGVKVFANMAVGYDNIDIPAATARGILVTNTPGVLTEATAEFAWALLFAVARRVVEADKFMRAGKYRAWGPMLMLGQEIHGKILGVIGGGRIGTAFARRAKGFDLKVLYTDVRPNAQFEAETGGRFVDKDTLLRESDFVSIHVPLTPSTRHLIGERELKLMKKSAILINTSRGPVVDEAALVKALREGEIWGAGLDVFEREPEMVPGLAELDNVVVCPHIASATWETRTAMATMAARNLLAALEGQLPPQCVNPEAYKQGR